MIRALVIVLIAKLLLPKDVWVGKHKGAYTGRWDIIFARLDDRGVLQGMTREDFINKQKGKDNVQA